MHWKKKSNITHKPSSSAADLRTILGSERPLQSSNINTSRRQLLATAAGKITPGQLLLQIHAARGRLHQTNEFVRLLAAPMLVPLPISEEDGTLTPPSEEQELIEQQRMESSKARKGDRFSNTLNLLSTFFYMSK